MNDGSLQCWGAGDQGQLGDNNTSDSTVARNSFTPNIQCGFSSAISSPHNGPLIDSGDNHSCVFAEVTGCGANGIVDYHRGVMCWGRNDFGQLGRNSTSTSSGTPAPVFGLDANILSLATGANHTCVVDVRGRVFCWGINNQGQCALPLTTASVSVPTQVNLSGKAVQVTAGLEFTCALLTNGTVQCWGANNFGMLGRTTPINVAFNSTPVPFDGSPSPFPAPVLCGECTGGAQALTNVVQVSAGDDVVCARIATGEVRCWGHNLSATGAFGTAAAEATRILGCGNDPRFCGCGTTGMWCMAGFGEPPGSVRSMGILPHAGRVNCNFNNPSLRALSVSAHALGACLVQPNGVTQCWGPNTNGVLGDNNSGVSAQLLRDVRLEVPEPGNTILNNVTNLSGGVMTKCALRNNGSALCWGFSSMGQAGTIATAVNTAHRVAGTGGAAIENFIAVAPGFGHSCGMTASGGVRCWGTNNYQVLGRELATIPPPASSPAALPVIFAQ